MNIKKWCIYKKYGSYTYENIEYKIPKVFDKVEFSPEESKALKKYVKNSWRYNKSLRNEKIKNEKKKNSIYHISKAIDKSSLNENIVVNRIIRECEFYLVKEAYEEFIQNEDNNFFQKEDFCSTYSSPAILKKMLLKKDEGYLLILLPKGTKAAYVADLKKISLFRIEKELIIQKGSKFEFVKDSEFSEEYIFVVKLISD